MTSFKQIDLSEENLKACIAAATNALDKKSLIDLAMGFCNVPSRLGHEAPAARYLHERMRGAGLASQLQTLSPNRSNVIAVLEGSGHGLDLMLIGHLEAEDHKENFFPARITPDNFISGVGIWNMKGAIACYVAAAKAIRQSGVDLTGNLLIAATAGAYDQAQVQTRLMRDEHQGYSVGTLQLLKEGYIADFGVVGEPTSFRLVQQHFGTTALKISIIQRPSSCRVVLDDIVPSPSALPLNPQPPDAISVAAELVRILRDWIPEYQARNRVVGVVPRVSISAIEGGNPFVGSTAKDSSIFVFISTPPGVKAADTALEDINLLIKEKLGSAEFMTISTEPYSVNIGPCVSDDSIIVTSLKSAHMDVFDRVPGSGVVTWHSDASPLGQYGIPAVNYGPPGKWIISSDGRFEDELVLVDDLVRCALVYINLIIRICTRARAGRSNSSSSGSSNTCASRHSSAPRRKP